MLGDVVRSMSRPVQARVLLDLSSGGGVGGLGSAEALEGLIGEWPGGRLLGRRRGWHGGRRRRPWWAVAGARPVAPELGQAVGRHPKPSRLVVGVLWIPYEDACIPGDGVELVPEPFAHAGEQRQRRQVAPTDRGGPAAAASTRRGHARSSVCT